MGKHHTTKVVWRDDMILTGYANDYSIPIAADPDAGGPNAGIRPMNLLLTSLAGCSGLDVISILRKKQQQITGFEVHVEGERADEHPKVFTHITLKFIVKGYNVQPAAVERSIELSRDKYCGAWATLKHTAEIEYSYEIIEAEPAS